MYMYIYMYVYVAVQDYCCEIWRQCLIVAHVQMRTLWSHLWVFRLWVEWTFTYWSIWVLKVCVQILMYALSLTVQFPSFMHGFGWHSIVTFISQWVPTSPAEQWHSYSSGAVLVQVVRPSHGLWCPQGSRSVMIRRKITKVYEARNTV